MSASVRAADREVAIESGCDDFIEKPISPRDLVVRLRRWQDRSDASDPTPGAPSVDEALAHPRTPGRRLSRPRGHHPRRRRPSDVLSHASRLAATIVGAHQAAMSQLPDDDGMASRRVAVYPRRRTTGSTEPFDPRAGIGRLVASRPMAERLTDVELARTPRYRDLLADARPPLRGFLAAPLVDSDGRSRGRVALSDPVDGDFTEQAGRAPRRRRRHGRRSARAAPRSRSGLEDAQLQRQAFFGVVSHELRTPITTIYGGIRMLGQAGARLSHDTREQLLEDITAESERLYRLVEDLLVLSRAERDALDVAAEPILLQHLLARVAASEQQRAPWSRLRVTRRVPTCRRSWGTRRSSSRSSGISSATR